MKKVVVSFTDERLPTFTFYIETTASVYTLLNYFTSGIRVFVYDTTKSNEPIRHNDDNEREHYDNQTQTLPVSK